MLPDIQPGLFSVSPVPSDQPVPFAETNQAEPPQCTAYQLIPCLPETRSQSGSYKYSPFPLLLSSMTLYPSFLNATHLVACPLLPSCLWFSKCNIFAICIRVTQRAGYNAWPHSRPTDSGWGPWGAGPANAPAYYQGPQGIPWCTKSENATLCLLLCFAETERKFLWAMPLSPITKAVFPLSGALRLLPSWAGCPRIREALLTLLMCPPQRPLGIRKDCLLGCLLAEAGARPPSFHLTRPLPFLDLHGC